MWYIIDGKAYCQDYAPRAARAADVGLAVPSGPRPATPGAGLHDDNSGSRRVPAGGFRVVLESADPDSVRLEAGAVDIISASGWIRIPRGYHVLRKDGTRTGLAITPWVEEKQGELVMTPDSWVITHLSSGLAMTQPYSSVAEARLLVSILAQIDWRRRAEAIWRREMEATAQVVKSYNEVLDEAMTRSGDRAAAAGSGINATDLFRSRQQECQKDVIGLKSHLTKAAASACVAVERCRRGQLWPFRKVRHVGRQKSPHRLAADVGEGIDSLFSKHRQFVALPALGDNAERCSTARDSPAKIHLAGTSRRRRLAPRRRAEKSRTHRSHSEPSPPNSSRPGASFTRKQERSPTRLVTGPRRLPA